MFTPTVQNYLKAIFTLQQEDPGGIVGMGAVSRALQVVPGTATTMVQGLATQNLVEYLPRRGVRLTSQGETQALAVLRRHRIVETFLVKKLGFDWSEIHEDAEQLEHAISDRLLERLDAFCGFPAFDPHGDPIPTRDGKLPVQAVRPLESCTAGTTVAITRIIDQEAEFLTFAESQGLIPETHVEVVSRDPAAEALTLRVDGGNRRVTLGFRAAEKIMVQTL